MKKNIFKISSALLLSAFALTSCHKTVTPRKLDGEWTVTAASGTEKNTNSDINGDNSSTIYSFNGSTMTMTSTNIYPGIPTVTETTTVPMTISYSFDKKAGTYTITTVSTNTYNDQPNYYKLNPLTSDYDQAGVLDSKVVYVYTSIEKGTFTISGGTGDIEKNTQIVLLKTSENTQSTSTYSYYEKGTSKPASLTGKYTQSGDALPTSETENDNHDFKSSTGDVLTVTSLKKGVMEVTTIDSDNYTSGAYSDLESNEFKFTLTAK
jgi:hypothetical protein